MLADGVLNIDVAFGHRRRHHIGTRLDAIGNHGIRRPFELRHALDLDDIRAGAANLRAHHIQEIR